MTRHITRGLALIALFFLSTALSPADEHVDRVKRFQNLHGIEASEMAAEAGVTVLGRFTGSRESAPGSGGFLDFQAYTYTRPEQIILQITFEPKSERELEKAPHADHFQVSIYMDMEKYSKLFESDEDVTLESWEGTAYAFTAKASGPTDGRLVEIHQETTVDAEVPEVTRKGDLIIRVRDGGIADVHMTKWARRSGLNPIGFFQRWAKVFDDSLSNMSRQATGLALRDEGLMGRVATPEQIRKAIGEQTPDSYREALDAR